MTGPLLPVDRGVGVGHPLIPSVPALGEQRADHEGGDRPIDHQPDSSGVAV